MIKTAIYISFCSINSAIWLLASQARPSILILLTANVFGPYVIFHPRKVLWKRFTGFTALNETVGGNPNRELRSSRTPSYKLLTHDLFEEFAVILTPNFHLDFSQPQISDLFSTSAHPSNDHIYQAQSERVSGVMQ